MKKITSLLCSAQKYAAVMLAAVTVIIGTAGCQGGGSTEGSLPVSSVASDEVAASQTVSESSAETSKDSEAGLRWVLTDTSYEPDSNTKNEYYNITINYEGIHDDRVRFRRSGGFYQDGKNYARCDAVFECQQPPASFAPGQTLSLEMSVKVENYEFASSTGSKNHIPLNACWVQDSGDKFLDENGAPYFDCGTDGNGYKTLTVTREASKSSSVGAKYEIKYCGNSFGKYTRTYELRE